MPSPKATPGAHRPRARCTYPGCQHAEHKNQCRAKHRGSRCEMLMDFQTGEPIKAIVCYRVRPQCPCPFETCPCGKPVAVAQLIPGGGYLPVERGSAGTGTLEVWVFHDAMYVRELADGAEPAEGRWRGQSHEPACPKRAQWERERAEAEAEAAKYRADLRGTPRGELQDTPQEAML